MERVGQAMSRRNGAQQFDYDKLVAKIMADPAVAAFIQSEGMTPAEHF